MRETLKAIEEGLRDVAQMAWNSGQVGLHNLIVEKADWAKATLAAPTSRADRLAAIIRSVDGAHSLGAGALAEAIIEHTDFEKCTRSAELLEDYIRDKTAVGEALELSEAASTQRQLITIANLKRDAEGLKAIRKAMGYVENASDTSVSLFQDDATRTFHATIGRDSKFSKSHNLWSETFSGLMQELIKFANTRED